MLTMSEIIGLILLIVVGLNLTANNAIISIMVTYIFHRDKAAGNVLRLLGAVMALSSVLVLTGYSDYAVYANIFIVLLLIFISIRSRNRAYAEKMNAREKLLKEYEDEIKKKRERVQELRMKQLSKEEDTPFGSEGHSVADLKKKAWNDGSMTNKDLINGFRESNK